VSSVVPERGRVYQVAMDQDGGTALWLVVSNNARNRALRSFLGVRLVERMKPELPSVVELGLDDPVHGRLVCDSLMEMFRDEIRTDLGAMSAGTMMRVATALRHALAI
jgi:mRNA interferase MazF